MKIEMGTHQVRALDQIRNGCVLHGGTGSGKSRTALAYYYTEHGGTIKVINDNLVELCGKMRFPRDLYVITTAQKRDKLEWEGEMMPFSITTNPEVAVYNHKVVVDSWNNIKKYKKVTGAFFIFDEQRIVGSGAWVKAFLNIAKHNRWILLSATPGDTWTDYIPLFMANGFYRTRTEFKEEHIVMKPFTKFPQIDRYINTGRLIRLRDRILVDMDVKRATTQHHELIKRHTGKC